jgi:hypothetical protein
MEDWHPTTRGAWMRMLGAKGMGADRAVDAKTSLASIHTERAHNM